MAQVSFSEVRLPRMASNGMILQCGVPVKIWGWGSAGEKVFGMKLYLIRWLYATLG